jgi:hypothetical protein
VSDPDLHALISLRRLRRAETDEARRDLAEALGWERELAERGEALRRDLDAGRHVSGDFDRDAFFAWWERMRCEREKQANVARVAEARTAAARECLANRRVAETAAEDALAREVAARAAALARHEQAVLEDVARALKAGQGQKRVDEMPWIRT